MTSETSGYELISQFTNEKLGDALGTEILTVSPLTPDDLSPGDWAYEPVWNVEDETLWLNFTSTVDGKIHCEVEVSPNANYSQITADQIRFKLDRTGAANYENYFGLNVEAYENSSIWFNVSGFQEAVVSCVICNDYPMTPDCSEVKNFTYEEEEQSSFQEVLMMSYFLTLVNFL
jgi:hypothetical protein